MGAGNGATATTPEITIISGTPSEKAPGFADRFSQRPFFILAAMLDRTLGDFLCRSYFAAAVKFNTPRSMLIALYRDDRPYKNAILDINPYLDGTFRIASGSYLPLDAFNVSTDREAVPGIEEFIRHGYCWADQVLVPSMMHLEDFIRFEHLPVFMIPKAKRAGLDERLVMLGLDPHRWYSCIFYREPTYKFRTPTPYRDVGDKAFEEISNWIIDELGGQVVRIGHPQMRRFPARPGFVDLSVLEDEFLLHAAAVSRARFMLATPAGPALLPAIFGVPFALTNAVSPLGAWDKSHLLLPRHILSPDGRRVEIKSMLRKGAWQDHVVRDLIRDKGFTVRDNSFEELREVARMLFEQTTGITGWRQPPEMTAAPIASHYQPRQPIRREVTFVQFPELAAKATGGPSRP
jgi:putative glycosyltransferase (TIGR04372 family)